MTSRALAVQQDLDLVREYTNGDAERAATVFVRRYKSFVYATAHRHLKSRDDAEDAAQEAFIRALGTFTPSKAKARFRRGSTG